MLSTAVAVLLVSSLTLDDPPRTKQPPTKEQLAAITNRGRLLAEYDRAAWHASDAIQQLKPKERAIQGYIARKTAKGWDVAFGRLRGEKGPYLIAYEASQGKNPQEFQVKAYDPPKEDAGFSQSAARAFDLTLKEFTKNFKGQRRPYNVAVLPDDKSQLWVYFVPAPTEVGIWPLGADVRYRVSPDGAKIMEKRPLHVAIIENPPPKPGPDNQLMMGMHTYVLDDTPEDTDVFHVLQRQPIVPEMVITHEFVFAIEADGSIKFVGKAEDVLKKK
jgi:hypothetical protein